MELNDYADQAATTAIYREKVTDENERTTYAVLGLSGEAGELAGTWKKYLRGDISLDTAIDKMYSEVGDVLWYVAMVAEELGSDLNNVALSNLAKLADRQKRGVLRGFGSDR